MMDPVGVLIIQALLFGVCIEASDSPYTKPPMEHLEMLVAPELSIVHRISGRYFIFGHWDIQERVRILHTCGLWAMESPEFRATKPHLTEAEGCMYLYPKG